ncbi:hypothetical protein FHX44_112799 [Pseudonocardia hierapolitana]|uniref:Uncharacterized protein n=1 Tax=Pseudonocardia hierapolitana TaxID=1128676 RepID=A0A561SPX8_9PSEU|nr:hypothetical protein [Pseudonocardia hierapolitana]TWF76901.1 hypothetical protein FHX44_112799 [Pseudonocardia hierapolitana]
MRRRLAAPGVAFATIGGLLVALTPLPTFTLKGGLATSGGYALALQIVLSLFLLAAIDDLPQSSPVDMSARRGGRPITPGYTDTTSDIRLALLRFYLWHPLSALFLAFGLATSLAALLIGLLPARSEAALIAVLLATALAQLSRLGLGYFGWCAGYAAGSVLALIRFDPSREPGSTQLVWLALVGGLWTFWGAIYGVKWLNRRRHGQRNDGKEHNIAILFLRTKSDLRT